MARMIPPVISASCRSPGEREIFKRLQDEAGPKDWIVLHSLDIAHHLRQIEGEADFVIIVPTVGVLCLEVKACHSLMRDEGLWYYGHDSKGSPKGPFKQASEAMHSLRNQVFRCEPTLSAIPFWSAVAFPFVEFKIHSNEWHPWQVFDSLQFRRQPLATLIIGILRNARTHLKSQPSSRWFHEMDRLPNPEQAATIARILRPSFEFSEKPPDRRARQESDLLRYTEEQFVAIDAMADNNRALFTGPAGTGKTVLALEAARRATNSGKKVLFLCFNKLLGRWLLNHPVAQFPNIRAGTIHQYMLGIGGVKVPQDPGDSFWNSHLPEAAVNTLLSGHPDTAKFDLIIADEVQDLLSPLYLDVMDLVLQGGLAGGRWLMFGDFERQMLYGQDRNQVDDLMSARLGTFSKYSLRVNCRNTPRIAAFSCLLGNLTPNYSRVLRPDDRIEPQIKYYSTPSQQRKLVASTLEQLQRDSFGGNDIVILSPKAGSRCTAAEIIDTPWADQIAPFDQAKAGQIRYTTIQSFKGMDSPAIVVTDIEKLAGDLTSSLFYVATTRALERLCVFVHETAKSDILKALSGSD